MNQYAYSPYGRSFGETETIAQPFTYVGQYGIQTEDNDIYYMRARYSDAETGRFISEDSIGFDGGINLYAYASMNPVLRIDPSGLVDIKAALLGIVDFGFYFSEAGLGNAFDDTSNPGLFEAGSGALFGDRGAGIGRMVDLATGVRPGAIGSTVLGGAGDVFDTISGVQELGQTFSNGKNRY